MQLDRALRDPRNDGVIAVTGGWNSIELLRQIDFDALRDGERKTICGMSDITTLTTAFATVLGWQTFYGPNLVMIGNGPWSDRWVADAAALLTGATNPIELTDPDQAWTKDSFAPGGDGRPIPLSPMRAVRTGTSEGAIFGGHLGTLTLLSGTRFWPCFDGPTILFIEDDALLGRGTLPEALRRLEALLLDERLARNLSGLVVGRFEPAGEVDSGHLADALRSIDALSTAPVVIDAPFGHTRPVATLPIGGTAVLAALPSGVELRVQASADGRSAVRA